MHLDPADQTPGFFTRKGLIKSPKSLLRAQVIRAGIFEKHFDDGTAIRFVVKWLRLPNGQVVPTVERADLLPLLEEVLDALGGFNA